MIKNDRIFALGFFDGVHLGHQALLEACSDLAREQACQTAAITFDRHPKSLFQDQAPVLISTAEERRRLLRHYGIEFVHQYPVTETVINTPWQSFLRQLLALGAAGFVCGDDFRFGFRGEGTAEKLKAACKELGIPCIVIPEQVMDGVRISSTHIRRLIEDGQMESAVRFLDHPFAVTGDLIRDSRPFPKPAVPTADLLLPEGLVTPKFGTYACRAVLNETSYPAFTNISPRSAASGSGAVAELRIPDFEGDLCGREIRLEFFRFLRPRM